MPALVCKKALLSKKLTFGCHAKLFAMLLPDRPRVAVWYPFQRFRPAKKKLVGVADAIFTKANMVKSAAPGEAARFPAMYVVPSNTKYPPSQSDCHELLAPAPTKTKLLLLPDISGILITPFAVLADKL
jgi:hypothetical protein